MKPIDKLLRDYKRETKRMATKSNSKKVNGFLGYVICFAALAMVFDYSLNAIVGKDVPWPLDFFSVVVFYAVFRKYWVRLMLVTFVVLLIASYSGVTFPLLMR
jgi:hypothetical protein